MAELSFKLSTGLIDYPIVGFLGGEVFTGANLSNPHIPGRIKRFGKVLRCFAIPSRCLFGKQIYMVGWENMPGRVQAAQRYQITIILALDWRNRKKIHLVSAGRQIRPLFFSFSIIILTDAI